MYKHPLHLPKIAVVMCGKMNLSYAKIVVLIWGGRYCRYVVILLVCGSSITFPCHNMYKHPQHLPKIAVVVCGKMDLSYAKIVVPIWRGKYCWLVVFLTLSLLLVEQ
jgi:hypothetical protein